MHKKRTHKIKGISPLVATVLLIGFTIVIASMVFIWGGDIFKKYQTQTETESMIKLDCVTKINLNIKEACILGDKIKFKVENLGDKEISGFIIRTVGSTVDVSKLDEKLSPFGVSSFETNFNADPNIGIGIPRELEVYPRIIYEGKEGTCDKTSINLKPCYKLPSLLSFDDWGGVGESSIRGVELIPEGGIKLYLTGTGKIEIKSKPFIIPNEDNLRIHIGGKTNGNGNVIYNLKKIDGTNAITLSDTNVGCDIEATNSDISNFKNKEVYFSILINGNDGDYAILNKLSYTKGRWGNV